MLFQHQPRRTSDISSSAGNLRALNHAVQSTLAGVFLLALFAVTSCGKDSPTGPAGPSKVVVTPNAVILTAIGQTVQLDVQVQFEAGTASSGHEVVWASRNPSVATVSSGGLVTALGNGTADITATAGQKQGRSSITVSQSVRTITVDPPEITLTRADETAVLKASVLDENGQAVDGAVVKWTISDESVATISDEGKVTALRNGSAVVTVSSGEVSASVTVTVSIDVSDRTALIDFYHALDGPNWEDAENWLSEEPLSEWHGITTDANSNVIRLELRSNNLSGTLPENLVYLSLLRELDLVDNQVSGAIPVVLSQLEELRIIDLGANELSGSIPDELALLANMEILNLGNNRLSETVPAVLGQMTSLTRLDIGSNDLTGPIPPELGQLANLEYLALRNNDITGSIPAEIGQLSKLEFLHLDTNKLTGPIPPELGDLESLEFLNLWRNQLSGEIPVELTQLENLERLDLDENKLSGTIPADLGQFHKLEVLVPQLQQSYRRDPGGLGRSTQAASAESLWKRAYGTHSRRTEPTRQSRIPLPT